MKMNKVKEIGFYKAINDERPNYIFEVIKNTDKEWLKDNPKAILLVAKWGYEYTDNDDRRHYETFGSLTQVQNADEIEVEKMTENFIIYLTEDKPTYKEKYLKLKEENAELKEENYQLQKSCQICENFIDGTPCKPLRDMDYDLQKVISQRDNYIKALEEISEIADKACTSGCRCIDKTDILIKINEVLKDE